MGIFMSLFGMAMLIGIAVLFSENRKAINVRTVLGALLIQIAFGAFVMYVPAGQTVLQVASSAVQSVINFANAAMATRELLNRGLHCGLGSDVAASVTPSMLRSCFDAVTHSRVREEGTSTKLAAGERGEENTRISFLEAFWMATTGGGKALDKNIGVFNKGFSFDAVLVDASIHDCDLKIWQALDSSSDILEKIISTTNRQNITRVWVQGREVVCKK